MTTQPSESTLQITASRPQRRPLLWFAVLSALLCAGILLTLSNAWRTLAPSALWPMLAAAAVWALCALADAPRIRRTSWAWLLWLLPWLVLLLTQGGELWRGFLLWINCILTNWNTVHESALRLFDTDAGVQSVLAISLLAAVFCVQFSWLLVSRRQLLICGLLGAALFLLQLLNGAFSSWGCALYLCGYLALWMSAPKLAPNLATIKMSALCALALCLSAAFSPQKNLASVDQFRGQTERSVHTLRYGEDLLPQGNLSRATMLGRGETTLLNVQTGQDKTLYLRGFVGSVYENGAWRENPGAAYGEAYDGMLDWLAQQDFDPLRQSAQYYALTDDPENTPEANTVLITVSGASRYYLYTPVSTGHLLLADSKERYDTRLMPTGLSGPEQYAVEEYSPVLPSELTVTAAWLAEPETPAQARYCEAESVYRAFVYNTYTTPDAALAPVLQTLFWDNYEPEHESVYAAVCRVRDRLNALAQYAVSPGRTPDGTDPLLAFLQEHVAGNAAFYASAAVQALRAHGIPARYVEGYYVSAAAAAQSTDGLLQLTGQNAHTWAEVYFDGVGWLPVDVTPGYYYEARELQEFVAMPDNIRKTAALDESGNTMDTLGDTAQKEQVPEVSESPRSYRFLKIIPGLLALLILLVTLLILMLEAVGAIASMRMHTAFRRASAQQQAAMLHAQIFTLLRLHGIDASLGWNAAETDAQLAAKLPAISPGTYCRVVTLLEKALYGGHALAPFELRTLVSFAEKLSRVERPILSRDHWQLRYGWVLRGV